MKELVFISQPFSGLTEDEVMKEREKIKKYLLEKYSRNIEILDNYHHEEIPEGANRLYHLGRSIQQMSDANYIYFSKNWYKAKGCIIERLVCKLYKLKRIK